MFDLQPIYFKDHPQDHYATAKRNAGCIEMLSYIVQETRD